MNQKRRRLGAALLAGVGVAALGGIAARRGLSSDHADTPQIADAPGTDLTDVFIFPSPENSDRVVLTMCVHPLIPAGGTAQFDPNVLYQFKIDNNGDHVEDLVIQARFNGTGAGQQVVISGPARPFVTGTTSAAIDPLPTGGMINQSFSPDAGMRVFTGVREDPFFFDLEQFFTIFPDRATPITKVPVPLAQANVPKATSWRAPGVARDFLAGFNLLAIVVEVPKDKLRGAGDGKIAVWCTTSK